MDELPSEAKSILSLAKQAQPKAEPGARERVREGVEAALAATAIAHGEQASQSLGKLGNGKGFLTSTKIMLASGALLMGGGSVLLSMRAPEVAQRSPSAPAEVSAPEAPALGTGLPTLASAEASPPARSAAPAPPRARLSNHATPEAAGERRFSLAAEMSLLSDATDALANRDPARARALLLAHQKRFKNAQLREEREGLWVLVRCLEEPSQAHSEAAAFVRRSPTSLLASRVKRACGLVDGT